MLRFPYLILNQWRIEDCGMGMQSQIQNSQCEVEMLYVQPLAIKKLKQNDITATITQMGESMEGGAIASTNPILGIALKRGGA